VYPQIPVTSPTCCSLQHEIESAQRDEARRQAARNADDAPSDKAEEPPPTWMQ